MTFEFNSAKGVGLLDMLASCTDTEIQNGIIKLPASLGKGYVKTIPLGPSLGIMIHAYELTADVKGKRQAEKSRGDIITFSFRNAFNKQADIDGSHFTPHTLPSVQVSSGSIDLDMFFPAKTKINTIIITIHIDLLKDLINKKEGKTLLKAITSGNKPYLYEEIVSPDIQKIANAMVTEKVSNELMDFYFRQKAEEMIYLFFVALLKRRDPGSYPLNATDVKMIYKIRDRIIVDLSEPPNIPELALLSRMSVSKMNRLFKQIFGYSLYNYHQMLRINDAAYLIKHKSLSVSEAGYKLGFTNLSHFTRIFERHIGLKPKKYSMTSEE